MWGGGTDLSGIRAQMMQMEGQVWWGGGHRPVRDQGADDADGGAGVGGGGAQRVDQWRGGGHGPSQGRGGGHGHSQGVFLLCEPTCAQRGPGYSCVSPHVSRQALVTLVFSREQGSSTITPRTSHPCCICVCLILPCPSLALCPSPPPSCVPKTRTLSA